MSNKMKQKVVTGLILVSFLLASAIPSLAGRVEYIYDNLNRLIEARPIGVTCSYLLNPTHENYFASGGTDVILVTATAGCGWTAVSSAPWITIRLGR